MAQPVNVKIELEGKLLTHYSGVKIWQDIFNHHRFEIEVPFELLEEKDQHFFNESHKVCGKSISFSFEASHSFTKSSQNDKFDLTFKGIITSVSLHTRGDMGSYFTIGGYSPTILMEDSIMRRVYHKMSLSDIASKVISAYPSNSLKKDVQSSGGEIPYIVQYNETNYQFIRRLADEYGQWFYYDGSQVIFGSPKKREVKFQIDGEQGFDVSLKLQPSKFKMTSYVYGDDKVISANGTMGVNGLNQLGTFALQQSDKLFSNTGDLKPNKVIFDQSDLNARAKVKRSMNASSLVVFNGLGEVPNITVGNVIEVSGTMPSLGGRATSQDFGKYVITEIQHIVDETGNYSNKFKAVPESVTFPPSNPEIVAPIAHPEVATVTSNEDPESLGRVKVKFYWPGDSSDIETDWIRVGTFYSGGGDGLGMHYVPEVNAQVVIGYEQSHPEYPFVMTSLYPKTSKVRGAAQKNEEKFFQTYAGNQIALYDTNGSNKIEITNINNTDTAITLEFASNGIITLKTKGKVDITADEAISLKSNQKITMEAMDIQIKAKNGFKVEATAIAEIKAAQLKLNADASAELKAGAMVKIEGALADINAKGITTIGGALVKIN